MCTLKHILDQGDVLAQNIRVYVWYYRYKIVSEVRTLKVGYTYITYGFTETHTDAYKKPFVKMTF